MRNLRSRLWFVCRIVLGAFIGFFLAAARQAMAGPADTNAAIVQFTRTFREVHEQFLARTNNPEIAWHFARACFDLADIATNNPKRAEFASEGIAAARHALALDSNSAPAHYYLGMNLGELADTRHNLSALHMTREMEREFLAADRLDEHFDYAGADRNLGLLYLQAPVVFSVGDRAKGRRYLEAAVRLAPEFPENRLNLIEAYLNLHDTGEALGQLADLEKLWPAAQKEFTGPEWALTWADWDARLSMAKKRLATAAKTIESPHGRP